MERFRVELTGYCYRMLADGHEAEDAVQETFVKATRAGYDESRGALKSWLYAIATNVCLDMLRGARRRALAVDLGPAAEPGAGLGAPLPPGAWVRPMPDHKVLDPADQVVSAQSVRLAFLAALQHLPPKQRVVLILRDVLCWQAAEVATLLGTTTASVTSALQRARAVAPFAPSEVEVDQRLLDRYCKAFQEHDIETLVALLHEDATTSMPPFPWWLRGKAHIRATLEHATGTPCIHATLVPLKANGGPAFAHYDPDGNAFAIVTLDTRQDKIVATVTHLDPALFPLFDQPMSLRAPVRTSG
ncbi:RNA polymerase subunit sigma-70 [Actinokineospora auranticolor]|uniref:RNA polymerase sigma-70 factor (ECF subfamily) n=1 Tax=Actinokineospora auranticolor TaxID=155976 RepID=A0A2S6GQC0_9PSEU|nr:RNA polymerase subunit sigma-70 [Actinokineospora auranticolor]PPK67455.1 RNA polymerase sigma-70 factor (ECF subfamily) [Actinokineospora auranticolor]